MAFTFDGRLVLADHGGVEGEEAEQHQHQGHIQHQSHHQHHESPRIPAQLRDRVRRGRAAVVGREGAKAAVSSGGSVGRRQQAAHVEQGGNKEADRVDDPRAEVVHVEDHAAGDRAVVAAERPVQARPFAVPVGGGQSIIGRHGFVPLGRDGAWVGEDGHKIRGQQQGEQHVENAHRQP
eukprot:scaffold987_cov138-Isochrysis_galbana.AAC.1